MDILDIQNVTKVYEAHRALDAVSMQIPTGSVFGLLGPNGAGKTSLIRIINQITAPDEGQVLFNGEKLSPKHIELIGYLPEERGLYKRMEVGEQALYLARLKGLSKEEAAKRLRVWFEKFEIQSWWKKKVSDLSKGMQQKVQFIITVVHEPPLLILDEPFTGFDPINAALVRDELLALKNKGTTIILSTHRMESVEELCTHIALINRSKKVLEGSVKDVRQMHRSNTFEVEYKGTAIGFSNALWAGFELVENLQVDGVSKAKVKLLNNHTTNDLLKVLLPEVEILSLREVVPGMSDIFISMVGENNSGEKVK